MKTRIIIADDHKIIREGLKSLLSKDKNIDVIAEASNGQIVIDQVGNLKPDLVIMDVNMPIMSGIEATNIISEKYPNVKIVALSVHSDKRFVRQMFTAGAHGYMLKDCAYEEIVRAVQTVMNGSYYLSPGVTGVVIDDLIGQRDPNQKPDLAILTEREQQVLKLLAEGLSTKEIASKIHLSVKTIETHRKNIMDKLNIRTVALLTKFAIREGLTSLDV